MQLGSLNVHGMHCLNKVWGGRVGSAPRCGKSIRLAGLGL